ncbi:PLP-dependent transferase, partial [Haematococcus lacustris]
MCSRLQLRLAYTPRCLWLAAAAAMMGNGIAGGEGSIYLWARLPEGCDDEKAVVWLVRNHGVCVIPGSTCGAPGFVRVSFANLKLDACKQAAERLKAGLSELVALGVDALS